MTFRSLLPLALEDGTDVLSLKVGHYHSTVRNILGEREDFENKLLCEQDLHTRPSFFFQKRSDSTLERIEPPLTWGISPKK